MKNHSFFRTFSVWLLFVFVFLNPKPLKLLVGGTLRIEVEVFDTSLYRLVRLGNTASTRLKIRCRKAVHVRVFKGSSYKRRGHFGTSVRFRICLTQALPVNSWTIHFVTDL
jgi:hypothetical protein